MPRNRTEAGTTSRNGFPECVHWPDCCIVALLVSCSHTSCRVDRASILELPMDGPHFDHLTRIVGSRLSRRTGLGLLAAVGLIGRNPDAITAGKKKGKKK